LPAEPVEEEDPLGVLHAAARMARREAARIFVEVMGFSFFS
jgi:hypothetical protein